MSSTDETTSYRSFQRKLISACHILHPHQILDAYGHISVRHPTKLGIFILPRNLAPALVTSERDLVEYYVSDASPVDPSAPDGYIERYIHSEIYKKYSSVQSVIHSHAEAIIPYSISGVPLRPCFHMAGFLGTCTPIFDIADYYRPQDTHDMLVSNVRLGAALASTFSAASDPDTSEGQADPNNSVVLMRGHGLALVGRYIEDSVFRAIYAKENASIQTTALTIQSAMHQSPCSRPEVHYLNEDEAAATAHMTELSWPRAWHLWLQEVEADNLYSNQAEPS